MNCLFETTTKYTLEEYERYNLAVTRRARKARRIIYGVMILALVAESLLFGLYFPAVAAAVFVILWFAAVRPLNRRIVRKTYESNKLLQDAEVTFSFCETYFVEKTENGESRVPYDQLNRIIETPKNVYLMIAKNQGYVLVKENFPEGLEDFLRGLPVKR